MMEPDAVLASLNAVFGQRITAVEVERTVADRPVIKIRVELLSLRDTVAINLDGEIAFDVASARASS